MSAHTLRLISSVGYVARGIVYLIVGGIACMAALGTSEETTGSKGALQELFAQPFGKILLGAVGLGLACYSIWRFLQSIADADNRGVDAQAILVRVGFFASGLINFALAAFAMTVATGIGLETISGGGGSSVERGVAWLLDKPLGQWLVGIVGIFVIGVALALCMKSWKESFEKRLQLDRKQMKWVSPICKIGLIARGVVLGIVGGFLIVAAYDAQPGKARGVGGAMRILQEQAYGSWLLGIVAVGLIAFGIYCLIAAAFRRIEPT